MVTKEKLFFSCIHMQSALLSLYISRLYYYSVTNGTKETCLFCRGRLGRTLLAKCYFHAAYLMAHFQGQTLAVFQWKAGPARDTTHTYARYPPALLSIS